MTTDILIVTYKKDFPWLRYCLRSIDKFATGFHEVRIVVPVDDVPAIGEIIHETCDRKTLNSIPITVLNGNEWPGAGMCWHMAQIMWADKWCPRADFIAHLDPDCVFTGPVTPDTYLRHGQPILRYEKFSSIGQRHPGVMRWKECANNCLPWSVEYETMRCHPEVYHRHLYAVAREQIQQRTGLPVDAYIKSCRNEFPQTFCEFVTLGNVAMRMFPTQYHLVEQTDDIVTPNNHLQQFWSHGPLDQPQSIWVRGREKSIVPSKMLADLGLL